MTTNVGRVGFHRVQGKHLAAGYWGRYAGAGVHARLIADQTTYKALRLHADKILGAGLAADLWREVQPSPFAESAAIAGISILAFTANTPQGAGTLTLTLVGAARNVVWTAPGGVASPTVNVQAGGNFTLVSSGSSITMAVNAPFLPAAGGPFTNTVTFSRGLLRVPNFEPQADQLTVTNKVFPLCSCLKQTSKQSDNKCRSCFGTGIVPGYTKFGYREFFVSAIDPALTLASVLLFTEFTPYRLQLNVGATSGTILSPVFVVTPAVGVTNAFQFAADMYLRQPAGTSITIEFSLNAGPFTAIAALPTTTAANNSTIQFRVTLARTLAASRSPLFEMLRVRYPRLDEPYIRVLKGLPTRTRSREAMGVVDTDATVRFWTVPLFVFDDLIPQDPDVVAPQQSQVIQPKAFLEFREGAYVGKRYDLGSFSYSDPAGILISQQFGCRLLQPDEIQSGVF